MTLRSSKLPERKDCTCECHTDPTLKHVVFGCCRPNGSLEACETLYGAFVDGRVVLVPETPENAAEWRKRFREALR